MLCAMYFAQGVPWGFMVVALMAYLAGQGIGDREIGDLTKIVLVPWTFKLVWGPLIDTLTICSMGRRRPWIMGAELLMAVSLLGILMLGDLTHNLRLLGWMFFIHNCFASLQDVATDALAVDILPPNEQGKMNGFMWGSKLIGKAIGASVMAMVIAAWGLPAAVLAQFIILLIIMMFPIYMLERPGDKRFPWSRMKPLAVAGSAPAADRVDGENPYASPEEIELTGEDAATSQQVHAATSSVRSPLHVLKDLCRAFSLVTTLAFLAFGLTHAIGWGIVEVITKPLYTQHLGWTFVQVANVTGLAVFTEMFGALLGGFLADRFGRRLVMVAGFGCYGLLHEIFAALPELWSETWFAAAYLFLSPGVLALGSVGFLSMGMRISWTKASATMFTIYMTVSNIAHVIGNGSVGLLREDWELSYAQTFFVAAVVQWVPLLLLTCINPDHVDAARDRELLAAESVT